MPKPIVVILLFLVLIPCLLNSQDLKIIGTILVGAKCKDGAILLADSRSGILLAGDSIEFPTAYYDKSPKIFIEKQFGFGTFGTKNVIDLKFSELISKISSGFQNCRDLECIVTSTVILTNKTLASADITGFNNNMLFFISSVSGSPEIIYTNMRQIGILKIGFQSSDTNFKPFLHHIDKTSYDKLIKAELTCEQAAIVLERTMYKFIINYKKQNTMGGPISILAVDSTNNFHLIKNDFRQNDYLPSEIFKRIKAGKIKVSFTRNDRKARFYEFLDKN
jgi:hypothetical protein